MDEYKDAANIREQKKDIERLLESRAWGMIVTAVQAQADALQQEILFGDVHSEADLYRLERKRGQLEGRLALTATVEAMLQSVEVDLMMAEQRGDDNV